MKYLTVKTQNKRGNKFIYKTNLGFVTTFLRNSEDYICVDDFKGYGETYKQREMSLIEIFENGNLIFTGNKYELFKQLKK
jgi:hypothetical protein